MSKHNVLEIVTEYLKANGYDGLYNEYAECACDLSHLCPCGESMYECIPGYKTKDPEGEYDFLITDTKELVVT